MEKCSESNKKVKQKIIDSLFSLLKEKNFSEISITEIVNHAGVSRQSYYRNFSSKEDIILEFYYSVRKELISLFKSYNPISNSDIPKILVQIFSQYKKYADYLLVMYNSGFVKEWLEIINENFEMIFGDMPSNSLERYYLYATTGAMFNTVIKWLEGGAKESCEDMAKTMYTYSISHILSKTPNFE